MGYCVRRRVTIRRRLQNISKVYKPLGRGDVPSVRCHPCRRLTLGHFRPADHAFTSLEQQRVHQYITQEYSRACLIAYASSPKDGYREGWGSPGTRRSLVRKKA